MDDHLSRRAIADAFKRVSIGERIALYANLLAADRVYILRMSPCAAVGSYPTRFTLTPKGGFVSVALSLRLPAVAVNNCLYPMLPGLSSCLTRQAVV